jgi:hypothetical protein
LAAILSSLAIASLFYREDQRLSKEVADVMPYVDFSSSSLSRPNRAAVPVRAIGYWCLPGFVAIRWGRRLRSDLVVAEARQLPHN